MGSLIQKAIDISVPGRRSRKKREAEASAAAEAAQPELLMPDEEELRRQARRELAGRAKIGGRISTILTGRLGGPGGNVKGGSSTASSGGSTGRGGSLSRRILPF